MTTHQGNFGGHARRRLLNHSWLVGAFGVVVGLALLQKPAATEMRS